MTSDQPEFVPNTTELASGMPVERGNSLSGDSGLISDPSSDPQPRSVSTTNENDDEEQALESHEVIELQTFSEGKLG